MNETPIPRENTYASINTLSQHLLNPTTSDPPLPNFYPANIDSISSGSRINPNSIQNTQMARSLKRQEGEY
jgi:hypothetical protein